MSKKKRPPEPTNRSKTLVNWLKPGQTPAARMAEMMVGGLAMNDMTSVALAAGAQVMSLRISMILELQCTSRVVGLTLLRHERACPLVHPAQELSIGIRHWDDTP